MSGCRDKCVRQGFSEQVGRVEQYEGGTSIKRERRGQVFDDCSVHVFSQGRWAFG